MDSRFTMLYKQEGEDWRLVHIHQSLPNPEQEAGEYYPKTLLEQVEKTQEKVRFLQNLAQKDSLTGLLNFRTLQDQYQAWGQDGAWLFVIDIDDFKCINDTLGHLEGNRVLQAFAGILSSTVRADDVVSRMGGDEFVVLCRGLCGEENARELLQRLFARVAALRDSVTSWAGISAGATPIRHGEALETAFKRADHALYDAKRNGKNRFSIF